MEPTEQFFVSSLTHAFYASAEKCCWVVSIIKGRRFGKPFVRSVVRDMNFRGVGQLAKDEEHNGGVPMEPISAKPAKRKRDGVRDASVGAALRSVYSQTVDEAVPSEFLDLLNKLD